MIRGRQAIALRHVEVLFFDKTTGGKFSRIGMPGMASSEVTFGGDWMIQATFAE